MASPRDIVHQLNQARRIVLGDAKIYPQVVPGVLNVIGANAHLELRRWGSDFLAETFASPVLGADEKQKLCLGVLDTLRSYLNRKEEVGEDEDPSVVKSAVQCAASIYPFVFRHTVVNAGDSETWGKMAGIKSSILRRMDTAPAGVRICCIKFVARVVQTQTPGLIADPRRPEQNEISLALVPREHPTIPPTNLEAEASGLLDRLLGVLQDNDTDALVVTATLNSLSTLVQRRPSISTKILMTVLNFNPLKLAGTPMTGKVRVAIRSMTRTTMSFLLNVLKRNPQHQLAIRLQQRTEQLRHGLIEVFSENGLGKRKEPDEPTDGLDDAKRRRIEISTANGTTPQQQPPPRPSHPPLPPGPVTVAQLFTLSRDPSAAGFHVGPIPLQIVAQLVPPLLQSIDQRRFDDAINAVRARILERGRLPAADANHAARTATGEDEDDDYDPSLGFPGHDQVMNRLDQMPPEGVGHDIAVTAFTLPPAPPMTEEQRRRNGKMALTRVFGTLAELDRETKGKSGGKKAGDGDVKKGFNRLSAAAAAAGGQDREGWLTLVIRLATRATFGLDGPEGDEEEEMKMKVEGEGDESALMRHGQQGFELANGIREALVTYVVDDFRRRIDVAIAWLSEEWYADRLALQSRRQSNDSSDDDGDDDTARPKPAGAVPITALPNYHHWSLRMLETLSPYLDVKDGRHLIRFLSEIPQISREHLDVVRLIANDPERVGLASQALLYLIMLRPPVREMAIDTAEELWRGNEDARGPVGKILGRWRPGVLVEGGGAKGEGGGGGEVKVEG
ncbi:hypothetical protein LTR36_009847 [Oleoguttula mirabilis]|uniref:Symplekin/Pta1 N-terminal domain-containing protein n=1 Tax=Oleoguttula mirabilis TaxID=1507867 RepID=A0AAV9J5D8_9PEZI|nr:hypothetical protein LTR36_009847 [Oleoguttula mirabilis]